MSRNVTEKRMGASLSSDKNLLLENYNELSSVDQEFLLSYTAFLPARHNITDSAVKFCQIPDLLPRLVDVCVPKAVKRLSLSYPVLHDVELLLSVQH